MRVMMHAITDDGGTTVKIVVGAAVVDGGRLLVAQRAEPPDMRGRWELPGGSVEEGESEAEAVVRELREELAYAVVVEDRLGPDVPVAGRTGEPLLLRFYRCRPANGAEPVALEHLALRWVAAHELDTVAWLPADEVLLPALRVALGCGPGS